MHSTEIAQQLGFAGALVGGVTVWGWAVPAILEAVGDDWLENGRASFRFRQPVYPADKLRIALAPDDDGAWALRMTNQGGVDCVVGGVGQGASRAFEDFAAPQGMAPQASPEPRPELRVDPALVGRDWIPMAVPTDPQEMRAYVAQSHRSEDPRFVGDRPRLHPAWLVARAEALLRHNFAIATSIHTRSEVEFLAPAWAGADVVVGARCMALYERKGRPFVEFDCVVQGGDGRDLSRMRHTTIFDAMAGVT